MRRTEFRALGGSRVYKGAIWGKQIGNPGQRGFLTYSCARAQKNSAMATNITRHTTSTSVIAPSAIA